MYYGFQLLEKGKNELTMFDGSDEFHPFMASRTSSLPIPIPIPIPITSPLSFDPYSAASSLNNNNNNSKSRDDDVDDIDFGDENRSQLDPWSNDELLALLKATSTMEIWFPDFTWEHISRKLVELGFKRSAEQCKQRFHQETKHLNSTLNYNNNYRVILSELDELDPNLTTDTTHESMEKQEQADQEQVLHNNVDDQQQVLRKSTTKKKKKRKRKLGRFEIFKDLCEGIVNKMIANQEELHNKLIEDIAKRDEENLAREEALRNQEIEKINLEIQIRTKDQASSSQRQATLINFLNKFTFPNNINPISEQIPQETSTTNSSTHFVDSDFGKKRWPRDEVLALINLRCKINGDEMSGGGNNRGPLWERISQGMMELGYKRNSKRCKEKWENINKYFRKTKDSNKKRALDSRTCPYFHQLSSLYTDATQENH